MKKMNEILSSVAPNETLNKAKWDNLVEQSDLKESSKNKLKQLNDFITVKLRLVNDAGSSGVIISKLHAVLQNN